jgi:hypothetical protein
MTIARSFFSLLKTNNGYFKSEKQASFLLDHCGDGKVFVVNGSMFNNSYNFFFECDDEGVVRVEKHTSKKIETYWERDPDHDAFMKRVEAQAEEKRRRVSIAQRFERIRIIVNNKNADSTDRLLRMMKGKEGDDLAKSTMAYLSIENKIKKLDGLSDELLEEMNNWN